MAKNQLAEMHQSYAARFAQVALAALVRAEQSGRVPRRFTGAGREIWRAFQNELTVADLAAIAIQDAGAVMPLPFDPARWWPGWPEPALLRQQPADVQGWLDEALAQAQELRAEYLRRQAQRLGLDLPAQQPVEQLPMPAAHEQWLELPGTGGWVAFSLCTRENAVLYLWENFTIVCSTPQEMFFAGLIAWELGAPSNQALPITLDDPNLAGTLKSGRTYDAIAGLSAQHRHRDLTLLHKERAEPLWIE